MSQPQPPPLPPETRIKFWAPVVHYGIAAALIAAAIFHVDLHLSGVDQTIITVAAMFLVVAGTGAWIYFHHLGFKTFAVYLKSSVPGLLADVEMLKQHLHPAMSPQTADAIAKILRRLEALEPLVAQLAAGHPGVDKPVPASVAAVVDPPRPVDLATARTEVKEAAADLVTALDVEAAK